MADILTPEMQKAAGNAGRELAFRLPGVGQHAFAEIAVAGAEAAERARISCEATPDLLHALRQCASELSSIHGADADLENAKAHSAGLRMALDAIAKASDPA